MSILTLQTGDARHEKTDLTAAVFVVVIPKEGLAAPANNSLGITPTTDCIYEGSRVILICIVGVIPKEGLAGPQPANPSLGIGNDKHLKVCFFVTRVR